VRGAYQILYNYLSVLMWCAMILSSPAIGRNAQGRVASQVASPRRPRFAVGRLRTPVRSEIGRCEALAERATMLRHPGQSLVAATPR
jgi:hypothetical protein